MTQRITNADMARALSFLADNLAAYGWTPEDGYELSWGNPYGQVHYVFTYSKAKHDYRHDVPGFLGSGGSGFTSKREGYDRIYQTARVLSDLRYPHSTRERLST